MRTNFSQRATDFISGGIYNAGVGFCAGGIVLAGYRMLVPAKDGIDTVGGALFGTSFAISNYLTSCGLNKIEKLRIFRQWSPNSSRTICKMAAKYLLDGCIAAYATSTLAKWTGAPYKLNPSDVWVLSGLAAFTFLGYAACTKTKQGRRITKSLGETIGDTKVGEWSKVAYQGMATVKKPEKKKEEDINKDVDRKPERQFVKKGDEGGAPRLRLSKNEERVTELTNEMAQLQREVDKAQKDKKALDEIDNKTEDQMNQLKKANEFVQHNAGEIKKMEAELAELKGEKTDRTGTASQQATNKWCLVS